MSTNKNLSLDYSILCDDVRFESNGKRIFIGVYDQNISVSGFPISLKFFANIIGKIKGSDKYFEFKAEFSKDSSTHKRKLFSGKVTLQPVTLQTDTWEELIVSIPLPSFNVEEAGQLILSVKTQDAARFKVVTTKNIFQNTDI